MPSTPALPENVSRLTHGRRLDYIYAPNQPPEPCVHSNNTTFPPHVVAQDDATKSYIIHNIYRDNFECVALLEVPVRDHLSRRPLTMSTVYPPLMYDIRSAGSKGLGMFALHDISQGGIIVMEHPIILLADGIQIGAEISRVESYAKLFNRLPGDVLAESMTLLNAKPSQDRHVEGIMNTNALPIDIPVPGEPSPRRHWGLFLKTSRCNHSCSPNATYSWSPSSFTLTLRAVRPIRPNEEICIAYPHISLLRTRSKRQTQNQ